jgi:hypothetical protein
MSAVILLPDIPDGMTEAKIYTWDGVDETLVDTIPATDIDWQDADTDVSLTIRVSFTDGVDETEKTDVSTFEQKLISHVRNVSNIGSTVISDARIDALIPIALEELMMDICMFSYGEQLSWIQDAYYKLPNKYIFDKNCSGAVSKYDVEIYTQEIPTYDFTEQVEKVPLVINTDQRYVEFDAKLDDSVSGFITYYYTGRRVTATQLYLLMASKIEYLHYQELVNNASSSNDTLGDSIEIGDITIKSSGSTGTYAQNKNSAVQAAARYNKLVANFKKGFYRVR